MSTNNIVKINRARMREFELAMPVMTWLAGRGFTPFGEIPWGATAIDVVGLSDDAVWAVELKISLTTHVIRQAMRNQLTAHKSWCAVGTRPRHPQRVRHGIGLLTVIRGEVEVLVEAESRPEVTKEIRLRQLRGACAYKTPFGKAGLPTMKGIGPAQDVFDAVERFRASNPSVTWEQVYRAVPNHYAHARSLQGAMATVRKLRSWRANQLLAAGFDAGVVAANFGG